MLVLLEVVTSFELLLQHSTAAWWALAVLSLFSGTSYHAYVCLLAREFYFEKQLFGMMGVNEDQK